MPVLSLMVNIMPTTLSSSTIAVLLLKRGSSFKSARCIILLLAPALKDDNELSSVDIISVALHDVVDAKFAKEKHYFYLNILNMHVKKKKSISGHLGWFGVMSTTKSSSVLQKNFDCNFVHATRFSSQIIL